MKRDENFEKGDAATESCFSFSLSRYSAQGRLRVAFVGRSRCFEVEGNQAIPAVDFTNRLVEVDRRRSLFPSFFPFYHFNIVEAFMPRRSVACLFFLPFVSSWELHVRHSLTQCLPTCGEPSSPRRRNNLNISTGNFFRRISVHHPDMIEIRSIVVTKKGKRDFEARKCTKKKKEWGNTDLDKKTWRVNNEENMQETINCTKKTSVYSLRYYMNQPAWINGRFRGYRESTVVFFVHVYIYIYTKWCIEVISGYI